MSSLAISSIAFACIFGGALFGMSLRAMLPESHVDSPSRDAVRLAMGLVVTMAALVLGFSGRFGEKFVGRADRRCNTNIRKGDLARPHIGPLRT